MSETPSEPTPTPAGCLCGRAVPCCGCKLLKTCWAKLPDWAPQLILLGSIASVGGALFFQYVVGLKPCHLCYLQRWPYIITALAALLAWGLARKPRARALALIVSGLSLVYTGAIAAFHSGVERHWWSAMDISTPWLRDWLGGGDNGCNGVPQASSAADILHWLEKAAVVRCDEIPWEIFGITMANLHVPLTLGLALIAFIAASRNCGCCGTCQKS